MFAAFVRFGLVRHVPLERLRALEAAGAAVDRRAARVCVGVRGRREARRVKAGVDLEVRRPELRESDAVDLPVPLRPEQEARLLVAACGLGRGRGSLGRDADQNEGRQRVARSGDTPVDRFVVIAHRATRFNTNRSAMRIAAARTVAGGAPSARTLECEPGEEDRHAGSTGSPRRRRCSRDRSNRVGRGNRKSPPCRRPLGAAAEDDHGRDDTQRQRTQPRDAGSGLMCLARRRRAARW